MDDRRMSLARGATLLAAMLLSSCARSATPYRAPAVAARDSFVFWGWTEDGQRFAYESYSPAAGADPAPCSDEVALLLYDAAHDKPIPGVELRIPGGGQDEAGRCRIPDVRAVLDGERDNHLREQGVVTGAFIGASSFDPTPEGGFAVALGTARIGYAQLTALPPEPAAAPPPAPDAAEGAPPPPPPSASYQLTITLDGAAPRTLTFGPHPGAVSASLDGALAFTDPKQHFAALCLPIGFQVNGSTWARWDCHGMPLLR
jgi:hypothetical protein